MFKINKNGFLNFLHYYYELQLEQNIINYSDFKRYQAIYCWMSSDVAWSLEDINFNEMSLKKYNVNVWKYSDLLTMSSYLLNVNDSSLIYTGHKYFYFNIFIFFKKYNLDFNILYYLLNKKFNSLFYFVSHNINNTDYFFFLKSIFIEYSKLWLFFNRSTNFISPVNYFNDLDLINSRIVDFSYYNLYKNSQMITKKDLLAVSSRSFKNYVISLEENGSYFKQYNYMNTFIINYLRVQRRYNKRRYSKVRVYSRPSFFAGICLGSMFISCFWGGTIKSVDWLIMLPVVVNMNVVLLFLSSLSIIFLIINKNRILNRQIFGKFKMFIGLKIYVLKNFFVDFFKK